MKDYIDQATRTESIDLFKVDTPRLLHAAVGMSTEVAELLLSDEDVTNVKEELGDILWYVAIVASVFELDEIEKLILLCNRELVEEDPFRALLGSAGEGLDCIKRNLFYGLDLDEARFGQHVGSVLYAVQILAEDEGWTLDDLKQANIGKLSARYPEKFTTEAAVNRDVAAEMEAVGT